MKRILTFLILIVLTALFFSGCTKGNIKGGKIPYLPISERDVSNIELNGYSESEQHSNNRNATEEEKTEIINWLNNIKNYESEIKIAKYSNGRPEPSNIQIYTKDNSDSNYLHILEKDNGYIMISRPQAGIGYIVKQPELNKLLKQLRK